MIKVEMVKKLKWRVDVEGTKKELIADLAMATKAVMNIIKEEDVAKFMDLVKQGVLEKPNI